ncbi:TolB family protein [Pseudochryseolinea flava]|nr:hypothetical protein [Pseudochryseolinea flava]
MLTFCSDGFSYADPAVSPLGELYFISNRPINARDTTKDYDIWKTSFGNGSWEPIVNVASLNSPFDEYYISFTAKGDAYFSSSRQGGFGEEDLYMAPFKNGVFDVPVNLGEKVNTRHSEYDPFVNPDGDQLVFASSGRDNSLGKADLYCSQRKGSWLDPVHLGVEVNTSLRDFCPYISKDEYFYFSSGGEIRRVSKTAITKALKRSTIK